MRNQYPGLCYRCGEMVAAGDGHFERLGRAWRVQHADCAIKMRGIRDDARERQCEIDAQWRAKRMEIVAQGTGKRAQRARARIREREAALSTAPPAEGDKNQNPGSGGGKP